MPQWALDAVSTFGYLAVFLLIAIEGIGVPLPGETALLVAAALSGAAGAGTLDIRAVIAVAALGAIVGDAAGYAIGRRWGRAILERWGGRVGMTQKRVAIVERLFARFGALAVFFGRYQAVFRTYLAMVAGMARMPFGVFFPVRLASCVLWALIFGLIAYALGQQWALVERALRDFSLASIGAGSLAVLVGAGWLLAHRLRPEKATP